MGIIQSAGSSTTQTQPNRGLGSNSIILLIIIIAVVAAVSVSVIMIRRYRIKAGSRFKGKGDITSQTAAVSSTNTSSSATNEIWNDNAESWKENIQNELPSIAGQSIATSTDENLSNDELKDKLKKLFEFRRKKIQTSSSETPTIEKTIKLEPQPNQISQTTEPISKAPLETMEVEVIPAASITMPNIVETFDPEMQELYQAAQGYMESGEDSMAIKSYETLLRLAETKDDKDAIAFIKRKMDKL